jgi:hypothetical protein
MNGARVRQSQAQEMGYLPRCQRGHAPGQHRYPSPEGGGFFGRLYLEPRFPRALEHRHRTGNVGRQITESCSKGSEFSQVVIRKYAMVSSSCINSRALKQTARTPLPQFMFPGYHDHPEHRSKQTEKNYPSTCISHSPDDPWSISKTRAPSDGHSTVAKPS